jgi:hypothetical protein
MFEVILKTKSGDIVLKDKQWLEPKPKSKSRDKEYGPELFHVNPEVVVITAAGVDYEIDRDKFLRAIRPFLYGGSELSTSDLL